VKIDTSALSSKSRSAHTSIETNLPALDAEHEHASKHAAWHPDSGQGAVDERRLRLGGAAQIGLGHGRRADELGLGTHLNGGLIGTHDHVGIEHLEQRLEIAAAGRGEEGVDNLPLARDVEFGGGIGVLHARRARLASWRAAAGLRPTIGAISSNGTANMSCNTNASRSAGASVSRTTSKARPTESASTASRSGSNRWSSAAGGACSPIGSSRRERRERSMSRHTRATIVVR
jgi:hypothetical protein